jgi:hypothetical protein
MISQEQHYFRASLDKLARVITVLVTLLFFVVASIQYYLLGQEIPPVAPLLLLFLLIVTYALSFAFRPKGYLLKGDELVVLRPVKSRHIPLRRIVSATALERKDLSWSLRLFGVGGMFGYYGKFTNTRIGLMTWYMTRRDRAVLLRLDDGKKIIVSPDEREEFLERLQLPISHR